MSLTNLTHTLISTLPQESEPFVSKWVACYHAEGVAGLALQYEGSTSYLSPTARQEIIAYLRTPPSWRLEELVQHLETRYQVAYQSPQSYYDILTEAGLSWKRTQPINPKKNDDQVLEKRGELKYVLTALAPAVHQGTVSVVHGR
jgi:transposase